MKRKFCVDTLRVFNNLYADVVELVDTLALGASAARREGSSPFIRTIRRLTKRKHCRKRLSPDKGGGSFFISRF